jgi:hypothetical protein
MGASDTVYNFDQATGDQIIGETAGQITNIVAAQTTNSSGNSVIQLSDGSTITFVGINHVTSSFFS